MPWQTNKQNSPPCLVAQPAHVSGDGWATNKPVGGQQGHPDQTKVVKG